MLHRLFPHANESLASLAAISAQVGEAAALLSEMVGSPVAEYPALFERMLAHEADLPPADSARGPLHPGT